jgi:putative FmdB family regulatory protein
MPLYEYQCGACGHRFEVIQKFSDPPLEKCPKCGGALSKLQSAPAFQFKGSGWYVTDYAKKDSAAGKEAKPRDGKEAKSDSKTETKTESSSPASASESGSAPGAPAPDKSS